MRARATGRVRRKLKREYKPGTGGGYTGCLLWTGACAHDEWGFYTYGQMVFEGKKWPVHRWLWEYERGPLKGMLRNKCGNTRCCNLDHWEEKEHWHSGDKKAPQEVAAAG